MNWALVTGSGVRDTMAEWQVIEDNEQIKAEFTGYKDGAVRLKEGGWAMLPTTAAMIDTYKVLQ